MESPIELGKSFELQVMGTFEVRDGKINAWRDYFDQNQFTSRICRTIRPSRCCRANRRCAWAAFPSE
jgi:hypothetical protein